LLSVSDRIGTMNTTARQLEILKIIHNLTVSRGFPPTIREIGAAANINSPNGTNDHLKALESRGLIKRDVKIARSLLITETGRALLH